MRFFTAASSTLFLAAAASVSAASIKESRGLPIFGDVLPGGGATGCQSAGKPVCCDSQAQENALKGLLNSFGIANVASGAAGFNCIEVSSAAGAVQNTCKNEPICCDSVHSSGLFGLGCSPITVN